MSTQVEHISEDSQKKTSVLKKRCSRKPIFILVVALSIAVVFAIGWFGSSYFKADGKTTKLGFENIGELATQSATCTVVEPMPKDRKLFGVTIPLTESNAIYSCDTTIKAGVNFSKITWKFGDTKDTANNIYVDIPEIEIFSNEPDLNSLKVYYEKQSIFTPIKVEDYSQSMQDVKSKALDSALSGGLMNNALDNAKVLLKAFFAQVYDPAEYKVMFVE